MAIALAAGATTTVSSGTGFTAAWLAAFGLGLGLAMPQTMNAALSALSPERSGSGSALISAMRQVGATIGVAVLGTVLGTVYRTHLNATGLPAAAAAAAKSGVVAGVQAAREVGSAALLGSARSAFVAGVDTMLWVCGGIALASAILALAFLPRRPDGTTGAPPDGAASPAAGESGPERAQLDGVTDMLDAGRVSLRERKKARTRAALREHALRLFREQGYQATTVEQIAAAAEVSPSTFFRYFPTKEDVVLQDDMDTRMIAALEQQPAGLGPVAAIRAAVRQVSSSYTAADLDVLRETTALTMTVPEIRARALDEFARAIGGIAEAVAKRAGRGADDLAVRTAAGADHRGGHVGHHAVGGLVAGAQLRGHVRPHRRGARPAGSGPAAVRRPGCRQAAAAAVRRRLGWVTERPLGLAAEPPVARRMRSVSMSMDCSAPPALPYSCW